MNRGALSRIKGSVLAVGAIIASLLGAVALFSTAEAACGPDGWTTNGQILRDSAETWSTDVALGDVDGDGDPDALIADTGIGTAAIWLNRGTAASGTPYFERIQSDLGAGTILGVALGDLDGDGDLDAFLVGNSGYIWLNQGNKQGGVLGRFAPSGQVLAFGGGLGVALADLDGDGDLDAVTVHPFFGGAVWLNDGAGQFTSNGQGFVGGRRVALGDLNGDGKVDAFIANNAGPSSVWKNLGVDPADGKVKFRYQALFPAQPGQTPYEANDVALGDFDGDGDLDAALARSYGERSVVLENRSTAAEIAFSLGASVGSGGDYGVAVGKVNSIPGLFFADERGSNGFFRDFYWAGSWRDKTSAEFCLTNGNAELAQRVAVADLDRDGDTDAIVVGTVNRVWLRLGFLSPPGTTTYVSTPFLPGEMIDLGVVSASVPSKRQQKLWTGGQTMYGTPLLAWGYIYNDSGEIYDSAYLFDVHIVNEGLRDAIEVSCSALTSEDAEAKVAPGTYTSTLNVQTNDPFFPVVTYPLSCTVVAGHPFTELLAVLLSRGQQPSAAQSLAATTLTVSLAAAEEAPVGCTDAASFNINQTEARKLTVEVPPEFGGGTMELNAFDGGLDVSLFEIPGVTDRCGVRIGGGTFTAPSVSLPSGLPTGPNTLTFGAASQSGGEFNKVTGAFTATAMGTIVNDLFPNGVPIAGSYSGNYDPATGNLSVQSRTLDFVGEVPPPAGQLAPLTFDFPATVVGTPSTPQIFTVTSTSQVGLRIDGAGLSDTANFSIASNNCSAILPLNQHCAVGVVFAPASAGNFDASLTVSTSAGPLTAALNGNGIAPPPQFLPATVEYRPMTWNVKREGNWLTGYIELPEGFDPAHIDVRSVQLTAIDGNPVTPIPARTRPTEVGDFDRDGIRDRMVKFPAEALRHLLADRHREDARHECKNEGRHREIELQGRVDGRRFMGRGIVKVIVPGEQCEEKEHR